MKKMKQKKKERVDLDPQTGDNMENKKYYISTAIAYTSGKPHIGNTYEIVLADAIARFKRLEGYDVYFQTGTDEHGEKIELKAKEQGKSAKEFVDEVSTEIKRIWDIMDTSYDKFVRTTDKVHEDQVKKNNIPVEALGGKLSVNFDEKNNTFENVWLNGPAAPQG